MTLTQLKRSNNIEHIRRLWVKLGFGPSNWYTVNNGWCADFVLFIDILIPQVIIWSDFPEHTFVQIGSLFFDAETPRGVPDWKNLTYYKTHNLIQDRKPNPKIVSLKKFCNIWNFDYQSVIIQKQSLRKRFSKKQKTNNQKIS